MAYTPQQQTQITAAQAKIDTAQADFDNKKTSAIAAAADVNKCKGASAVFPEEADKSACRTGSANNYPGCAAKATCEDRVGAYNTLLGQYNAAETALETAKEEMTTLLDKITSEIDSGGGGNGDGNGANADLDKSANTSVIKWIILGVFILLIVGGFVYFKFVKKAL